MTATIETISVLFEYEIGIKPIEIITISVDHDPGPLPAYTGRYLLGICRMISAIDVA